MASAFWSVPSRLFFELELPRKTLWNDGWPIDSAADSSAWCSPPMSS
jgi:hypothetical protein